jgi:hypothetical protein
VDEDLSTSFGEKARIACALQYSGLEFNEDDILLVRGSSSAYRVSACAFLEDSNRFVLLVQLLERMSAEHAHSTHRLRSDWYGFELDGSLEVSLPYCWTWSGDDKVVILHGVK